MIIWIIFYLKQNIKLKYNYYINNHQFVLVNISFLSCIIINYVEK